MEKAFVYGMSVGGSKKHLMENIFQSRRMPFYQFGEMIHLKCIPTEYWDPLHLFPIREVWQEDK